MDLPELTEIHDRFLSLSRIARERFGGTLGGKLLLRSGFDTAGIGVVIAASTVGAASLCIEPDAESLREGLRAGFVDFVVTNLDEAVRILKNELRRARPVSVGVTADPRMCIEAMIERGLQPDLISAVPQAQAVTLADRGAIILPENLPDPATSLVEWSIAENPARAMPRIAQFAAESLDPARSDTPARRRWLEQSPRFLGRAFGPRQCLRMIEPEVDDFLTHAHSEFPSAKITRHGDKS